MRAHFLPVKPGFKCQIYAEELCPPFNQLKACRLLTGLALFAAFLMLVSCLLYF
jgi:hypothetical protein